MNSYERKTMQELVNATSRLHNAMCSADQHTDALEALTTARALLQYDNERADRSIYVAVGPNVWGRGYTKGQALDAACQENRDARKHHLIYRVNDPWAHVDDMGNICYALDSKCELVEQVKPKGKVRR